MTIHSCHHCNWLAGNPVGVFYKNLEKSTVYRSTNRFQYTFNITLNIHKTDTDIYDILQSCFQLGKILESQGISHYRFSYNGHLKKTKKGYTREHQHAWLVVLPQSYKVFDKLFGTVNGYSKCSKKNIITERPYKNDKIYNFKNERELIKLVKMLSRKNFYIFLYPKTMKGYGEWKGLISTSN